MRALLALVLSCTLFAGPRVTFVGDSLMVALSPGLTAALGPSVVNLHQKSGSHLTQWLKVYPEADLAIVLIGTNDCAGPAFMNPEWQRLYRLRLEQLLAGLQASRIIWVGIPTMGNPKFDARVQRLNELERREVSQNPKVTWVSPDPFLVGPGCRTPDGIHLTAKGAALVVRGLLPYTGTSSSR